MPFRRAPSAKWSFLCEMDGYFRNKVFVESDYFGQKLLFRSKTLLFICFDLCGCGWIIGRLGFFFFFLISNSTMEEITEGVNNINMSADSYKKNRIQVSNTKKPLFFYVNLAKRYMQQHNEVELSALGMAIATVVTVAEILKNNGFAVEKKIMTSTVDMKGESRGRPVQKAKIEIVLGKTANFDELMAAAQEERELGYAEEQN
ncbi:hypothetical protein LXL04_002017 [Taraxacum kok-saghyz]